MVANVVGFPGLIATRPKWTVPSKLRSMTGFKRSAGPMDVPPVVMMTSASSKPFWIALTWESMLQSKIMSSIEIDVADRRRTDDDDAPVLHDSQIDNSISESFKSCSERRPVCVIYSSPLFLVSRRLRSLQIHQFVTRAEDRDDRFLVDGYLEK